MALMNNETKLVTAGLRINTSIIIYNVDTYEALQSFYVSEFLIEMVTAVNFVGEITGHEYILNSFLGFSSKSIFYCDCSRH